MFGKALFGANPFRTIICIGIGIYPCILFIIIKILIIFNFPQNPIVIIKNILLYK